MGAAVRESGPDVNRGNHAEARRAAGSRFQGSCLAGLLPAPSGECPGARPHEGRRVRFHTLLWKEPDAKAGLSVRDSALLVTQQFGVRWGGSPEPLGSTRNLRDSIRTRETEC